MNCSPYAAYWPVSAAETPNVTVLLVESDEAPPPAADERALPEQALRPRATTTAADAATAIRDRFFMGVLFSELCAGTALIAVARR